MTYRYGELKAILGTDIPSVDKYFVTLDVLPTSFVVAMFVGFVVSKKYPPRAEVIKMIKGIDAK